MKEIEPQPMIPIAREQIEAGAVKLEPGYYVFFISRDSGIDPESFQVVPPFDKSGAIKGGYIWMVDGPLDEAIRIFRLTE